MLEKLKEILQFYTFLGPKDIFQLISIVSFKTLKKGEHIVRAGEYNYNVVLVLKGLLKSYVINETGEERTMRFVSDRETCASYQTIFRNNPSVENIVSIENSIIAMADSRKFEELAQSSPSLMLFENKLLKDQLAFTVDQVYFHLNLNAEQRYLQFYKDFPELNNRLSEKDLASYLGITATSLSRMKARIAKH